LRLSAKAHKNDEFLSLGSLAIAVSVRFVGMAEAEMNS
jgi:hypothetical protein